MHVDCVIYCERLFPATDPYVLDILAPPGRGVAVLSTERAESSQGLPVVVHDGVAYGPDDLGDHEIVIRDSAIAESARLAGYTVMDLGCHQ